MTPIRRSKPTDTLPSFSELRQRTDALRQLGLWVVARECYGKDALRGQAVKLGDADWLNFVNTALREAMTGVDFPDYKKSFETWFGVTPPAPTPGFPTEMR